MGLTGQPYRGKQMQQDLQRRTSIMAFQKMMFHGVQEGYIEDITDQTKLNHYFTPTDKDYGCSTDAR